LLVRFTDEREYLVDEAVLCGKHRLMCVLVECNKPVVRECLVDHFRGVSQERRTLAPEQQQSRRRHVRELGHIELILTDRLHAARPDVGSVHKVLPVRHRPLRSVLVPPRVWFTNLHRRVSCRSIGKTNPTHCDRVNARKDDWQPYRRALRREHQERFDRLVDGAYTDSMAGGALNPANVERTVMMGMLLHLAKEIDELRDELDATQDS